MEDLFPRILDTFFRFGPMEHLRLLHEVGLVLGVLDPELCRPEEVEVILGGPFHLGKRVARVDSLTGAPEALEELEAEGRRVRGLR